MDSSELFIDSCGMTIKIKGRLSAQRLTVGYRSHWEVSASRSYMVAGVLILFLVRNASSQ